MDAAQEAVALVCEEAVHVVSAQGAAVMAGAAPGSAESWSGVADRPAWAWSPDGARGALRSADKISVYDVASGAVSWSCEVEASGVAWGAGDVLVIWSSDALWLWPIGAKKAATVHRGGDRRLALCIGVGIGGWRCASGCEETHRGAAYRRPRVDTRGSSSTVGSEQSGAAGPLYGG